MPTATRRNATYSRWSPATLLAPAMHRSAMVFPERRLGLPTSAMGTTITPSPSAITQARVDMAPISRLALEAHRAAMAKQTAPPRPPSIAITGMRLLHLAKSPSAWGWPPGIDLSQERESRDRYRRLRSLLFCSPSATRRVFAGGGGEYRSGRGLLVSMWLQTRSRLVASRRTRYRSLGCWHEGGDRANCAAVGGWFAAVEHRDSRPRRSARLYGLLASGPTACLHGMGIVHERREDHR